MQKFSDHELELIDRVALAVFLREDGSVRGAKHRADSAYREAIAFVEERRKAFEEIGQ